MSSFAGLMQSRSAAEYADFLLPLLTLDHRVLDVGCGVGSITLGIAPLVASVLGIDPENDFDGARDYAAAHGIDNVEFRAGDVYALDLPDGHFDACLCHSTLETLDEPLAGLVEIKRVLKPGAVFGVACVEYGGLILAGPGVEVLRQFYALRQELWKRDGHADPYRGRELRSLLATARFDSVEATSKYICYGTTEAVRSFGMDRADDCGDTWYRRDALAHGLATDADIDEMRERWLAWSASQDAYAAFAWCRALGRKPL